MHNKKNIYFFYKNIPKYSEIVDSMSEMFMKNGFTVVPNYDDANIIASIGGDNAFLQATRKTKFKEDCIYVGISTDDIGMYTDFKVSEIPHMLESLNNDELEVRRYKTLKVLIDDYYPFYCLNECSIRSNVIKALVMDVYIDDLHFETFRGDGMIISTPTGSTAYNKSVRGAVVDPRLYAMQVSEIASLNNNDFRTLGTSFLLCGENTLTIKVIQDGNDFPIIGLDNEAMSIRNSKEIKLSLSEKEIKGLKLKNNTFWHKVKRKFL